MDIRRNGFPGGFCFIHKARICSQSDEILDFGNNEDATDLEFRNSIVRFIPKNFSISFQNIKTLNIEHCRLTEIVKEDLQGLFKLKSLNLSRNGLKSLPDDLFTDMVNLEEIDFSCNILENLSSKIFEPIFSNNFGLIDFRENSKIDAFYDKDTSGTQTIFKLMEIIDAQCKPPDDQKPTQVFEKIENLPGLTSTDQLTDFSLITGSKKFRVHKHILSLQSSVMNEMFNNNLMTSEMKIEDLCAGSVEEFVRFIYTGEIKTKANPMEIFALSSRLKVEKLAKISQEKVLLNLSETNVCEVLNLGNRYKSDEMTKAAFEKIKKMLPSKKLDENMMNQPERIKELIDAKQNYEMMLKTFDNFEA
jgi:Leucine-rich repeat (LRR) protein